MFVLLAVMPVAFGGCDIGCACTLPDPNWTAQPVSADDSIAAAAKFAAGSSGTAPAGLTATLTSTGLSHPMYYVSGPTVAALVDSWGGLLLEYVDLGAVPDSTDSTITAAQAQATAASFLSDRGWYTGILVAEPELRPGGPTAAYVVRWVAAAGAAEQMSVWVNPATGKPFAYADQRYGVQLVPPSIGAAAAGRLAVAAVTTPGMTVVSADFHFGFDHPAWSVVLESPAAAAGATPEHAATVSIDATTGTATVGNSR